MRSAELTQHTVASRDGTEIGYYTTGQGPAVVVLHGSMESARSHTLFAEALADEFTVYLPDRRGRGLSGPHRPDHNVRTEIEDLEAVLDAAGAQRAFGVSAGGAVVLEAARPASVRWYVVRSGYRSSRSVSPAAISPASSSRTIIR